MKIKDFLQFGKEFIFNLELGAKLAKAISKKVYNQVNKLENSG